MLTSCTQNRPLGSSITFDRHAGAETFRERFGDQHPVDRTIGYRLAWHEGALFGAINQADRRAHRRDVGGFAGSYSEINPRLGVILDVNEASEWYAASHIHEAPTTFELTNDANGGATPLDAMHGLVVETGQRGTPRRGSASINWDVSGYYTALRDEILSVGDPDAPGTSLSANIARTTHAGIEALSGASLVAGNGGHRVEPLISATFNVFSSNFDAAYGDNRLPGAPRWFARGEVMYRNPHGLSAGQTFDFVGPRYRN